MANKNDTPEPQGEAITEADILAELGLGEDLAPLPPRSARKNATPSASAAQAGSDEDEDADDAGDNGDDDDAEDEEDEDSKDEGEEDGDEEDSEEESEDAGEDDDSEEETEDEDSDEEDASEDETKEEDEQERLPKSVKKLQKRVSRLTARMKTAEEERDAERQKAADLQTKLEAAQAVVLQPGPSNPLSDLKTETDVQKRVEDLKAAKRFYIANLDGTTIEIEGKEPVELTASDVRKRIADIDDILQEHAPARLGYLRQNALADADAKKAYPELYKSTSEDAIIASNFLRVCPEIMRLPNYQLIVGDAIRGMKDRLKAARAGKKDAAIKIPIGEKTKRKAPAAISASSARRTTVKSGKVSKSSKRFQETGNVKDLAAMIEAGGLD